MGVVKSTTGAYALGFALLAVVGVGALVVLSAVHRGGAVGTARPLEA
jgi:hypothetical protein